VCNKDELNSRVECVQIDALQVDQLLSSLKKALWTEAGRSPDEFASFMRTCLCKCFAQNLDTAFPEIKRGYYVMLPEKTVAHLMHNYTIEYTKIIDLN